MKKLFGVLLVLTIMCWFSLVGIAFAEENAVSVSLDSPGASQSYAAGENVEITGTAENVQQVSLMVLNARGSIAYVAQPKVVDGNFTTGFQLNNDAVEGTYTIKIGAEGMTAPLEFSFEVSEDGTTSTPGVTIPDTGSSGGFGGGSTTISEKIGANGEPVVTAAAEGAVPNFNDVTGHWAIESITQLVAMGAITGYPDGSFRPKDTIKRAEFAAVLVKAFNLESQTEITFTDTTSHWAREYIATAVGSGVAKGYSSDTFGPDDLITREQMAVMVARAAGLEPSTGELSFADQSSISNWAREAIATMAQQGFMQGYSDNTIRPKSNASRGEAVKVIVNVLNKQ